MQQQQQQQPAPQVIVIQQPVMVDRRAINRHRPYLQRGVKFSNGCKCPGCLIILAGTFGFVFIYMGLIITFAVGAGVMTLGIIFMIIGAVGAISCCRLCQKARRDYNALPPDHPDRIKYSGVVPLAVPLGGTNTTYQLPPGAQVVSIPPLTGGQVAGPLGGTNTTYQFPPGAQLVSYPPSTEGQAAGYQGSPRGQVAGHPPASSSGGRTESLNPSAPAASAIHMDNDLPPSYEDAVTDTNRKEFKH